MVAVASMKYKELSVKEEREWLAIHLIALPEIFNVRPSSERVRKAEEMILKGTAMVLEMI